METESIKSTLIIERRKNSKSISLEGNIGFILQSTKDEGYCPIEKSRKKMVISGNKTIEFSSSFKTLQHNE